MKIPAAARKRRVCIDLPPGRNEPSVETRRSHIPARIMRWYHLTLPGEKTIDYRKTATVIAIKQVRRGGRKTRSVTKDLVTHRAKSGRQLWDRIHTVVGSNVSRRTINFSALTGRMA